MSIKRSFAWLSSAQGVGIVLQFASSVVLARYLTPYEMGIYAVAIAVVGSLSLFQQLSLPALIVREEVLTEDIVRTSFTINAAVTALLALVLALASVAGAHLLGDPGVGRVLLVIAITPLFGIFAFLPSAHLEREGRFKELAIVSTISSVLTATATISFALSGFSYMSIAYAQVVGSAAYAGLMIAFGRRHVSHRFGVQAWRRVLGFSVQMIAVSGLTNLSQRMSEVVLARVLGLSALGIYNRASGMNNLVWNNVHSVVGRIVFVDFSEHHRRGTSLSERYLLTIAVITAVLWPAFAGLALTAKPLIELVYGPRWLPSALPLVLLSIASIILASITMTWEVFTSTGQVKTQTRVEAVRAVVGIVSFTAGCFISLEAAAAARILDAVIAFMIYRPHLNRLTNTSYRVLGPIYAKSALLTVLAVTPAAVMMLYDSSPPVLLFSAAVATGIGLWGVGLFILGHPLAVAATGLLDQWITRRHRRQAPMDGA